MQTGLRFKAREATRMVGGFENGIGGRDQAIEMDKNVTGSGGDRF